MNDIVLILKTLIHYKKTDLLDKRNEDEQSPLQLAVMCHNYKLVETLMRMSAFVSTADGKWNTALHYALKENVGVNILECLLQDRVQEKVESYIDLKNNGKLQNINYFSICPFYVFFL